MRYVLVAGIIMTILVLDIDCRAAVYSQLQSVNEPVRISSVNFPPGIVLIQKNGRLTMEGYFGDIFSILEMGFNKSFHIIEAKDGEFGSLNDDGTWSGVMGDVVSGTADVSIGVVLTRRRRDYVDFSPKLYSLSSEILYRKLKYNEWQYDYFLTPYTITIWLSVFGVNVIVILMIWYAKRTLAIQTSINEFVLCWPIVVQSSFPISAPGSVKICVVVFFFFSVLILSIYTSLLTSLFSTFKPQTPFQSLEELVFETGYLPAFISGWSAEEYFKNKPSFRNRKYLEVKSIDEGIAKAFSGKVGFIVASLDLSESINENCSFTISDFSVLKEIISLAYSKQFRYSEYFNYKITLLREVGIMSSLYKRYFPTFPKCGDKSHHTVTLGQIKGPCMVLMSAVVIAVCCGIFEMIIFKFQEQS